MDWTNVNLKDSYERSQNLIDGYSFDTLLLEISTNLTEITAETITAYFNQQIRLKVEEAKTVFKDNLNNILADAIEYQNLDEEPNKPTPEQWSAVMEAVKKQYGTVHEIEEKGEYYLDYFTECLPPILFSHNYTLCSEPHSHNNQGKALYFGVIKKNNRFFAVITTVEHFKTLI
jgi:hypothetical protein